MMEVANRSSLCIYFKANKNLFKILNLTYKGRELEKKSPLAMQTTATENHNPSVPIFQPEHPIQGQEKVEAKKKNRQQRDEISSVKR